jgi:hypothetical protein
MTVKKAEPKPKKREVKQAEKAAVKKEAKSKTPVKGKKNPHQSVGHKVMESKSRFF